MRELLEDLQLHQGRSDQSIAAASRYRELYDAAPVGYRALDGDYIVEPNPAACDFPGDTHEHIEVRNDRATPCLEGRREGLDSQSLEQVRYALKVTSPSSEMS
ncbi:MAG: hypothetical protein WD382_08760 [Halofilum sp. (in: g-proteobacteria)]